MAISFPASPTTGDVYTYGGRQWQWNGYAWQVYPSSFASGLTVGASTISGGAAGQIVYDSGGIFNEATGLTTNGAATLNIGTQGTTQGSLVLGNTATTFSTTLKSSNSSTSAWTLTLPISAPAGNGYLLSSTTGGVTSWVAPPSLGITINTTAITGGTSGNFLYDNAGTVGEKTPGTGVATAFGNAINTAGGFVVPSAALTANDLVIGGGSGTGPSTTTTGTGVITAIGNNTNSANGLAVLNGSGALAVGQGGTGTTTALTSGSIVFSGASGVYTQDNANLFWNSGSAILLIGTNTATGSNKLQVATDALINNITVGLGGGSISGNTVVGGSALQANTTGSANTAMGGGALSANTSGSQNTAFGYNAGYGNINGGSNTSVGNAALYTNTSGSFNTAIGNQSLQKNTTADNNTAVGYAALLNNTTGTPNTAVGFNALTINTTGGGNVAVGYQALDNNNGNYNVAVGTLSLSNNTSGSNNVAIGWNCLQTNLTGSSNTAVGLQALYSTTATGNTAVGQAAAFNTSTGGPNTAIGYNSLYTNTSGTSNVAVGDNALFQSTGSNNVGIGTNSGNDAFLTVTTASNVVILGNNSTSSFYVKPGIFTASDIREKVLLGEVPHGLDFVNQINPIMFKFRENREENIAAEGEPLRYGFSAQEILDLEGETPVIVDSSDPDYLKMGSGYIVPILVNAIKELSAQVNELKAKVSDLSALK